MAVHAMSPVTATRDAKTAPVTFTVAASDDITIPTLHNLHLRVANSTTAGNLVLVGVTAPNKSLALAANEVAYIPVTNVTAYTNVTDRLIHATAPVGCVIEAFSSVS